MSDLFTGNQVSLLREIQEIQARRFWDIGVRTALGFEDFKAYLASIPVIPAELAQDDADYPLLVLVETRLGLERLCEMGGIEFVGNADSFTANARLGEFTSPTWIRIQDGRKNRGRSAGDCRESFGKDEHGLTALQGVCAYLHHPASVSEISQECAHVMDLAGTFVSEFRDISSVACFGVWGGQAKLSWRFDDGAEPRCGSASRRGSEVL